MVNEREKKWRKNEGLRGEMEEREEKWRKERGEMEGGERGEMDSERLPLKAPSVANLNLLYLCAAARALSLSFYEDDEISL